MLGKELLEKIKQVTNQILFQAEEKVAENFTAEKLNDSDVEVKYSELAVGQPVFQSSPAGDVPVENGTHVLDSGISFVTVDGLITEVIEAPEAVEELAKEEDKVEETKADDEVKKDEKLADNSELLQKIEALEAEIASIKEALKPKEDSTKDEAFTKLDGEVKALAGLLSAIAKIPVEFSKIDTSAQMQDAKNDRLKALADIISLKK
jgi:hypothetical protein